MRERIGLLTTKVPSLSVWNVWDLPMWAWREYRALHDEYVKQLREQARKNGA
ncbi:MAG: hypothetical protein NVSMB48_27010 [Marmoricola sp.]